MLAEGFHPFWLRAQRLVHFHVVLFVFATLRRHVGEVVGLERGRRSGGAGGQVDGTHLLAQVLRVRARGRFRRRQSIKQAKREELTTRREKEAQHVKRVVYHSSPPSTHS